MSAMMRSFLPSETRRLIKSTRKFTTKACTDYANSGVRFEPKTRFGIIGYGNIGRQIGQALKNNGYDNVRATKLTTPHHDKCPDTGISVSTNNRSLALTSDIIFVAVKPYQVKPVCHEIESYTGIGQLLICTAAGTRIKFLNRWSPYTNNISIMPNLAIGYGGSILTWYTEYQIPLIRDRLANLFLDSKSIWLHDENMMSQVTCSSGSASAYISSMLEDCIQASIKVGMDEDLARQVWIDSLIGTAQMLAEGVDPQNIIKQTTSQEGVTRHVLNQLEHLHLMDTIRKLQFSGLQKILQIETEFDNM